MDGFLSVLAMSYGLPLPQLDTIALERGYLYHTPRDAMEKDKQLWQKISRREATAKHGECTGRIILWILIMLIHNSDDAERLVGYEHRTREMRNVEVQQMNTHFHLHMLGRRMIASP